VRPIRGLAILAGAVMAVAIALPVAAAGTHTVTSTQHFHGVQPVADVNPCNGDTLVGSQTSNAVLHETLFPASDEAWFTSTEEDMFSIVDVTPGPSLGVTYTGHDVGWFGGNFNRQNAEQGYTFSVQATGSDGSVVTVHQHGHVTWLPDGSIAVSFDVSTVTCG
jgi:hypothetical protein